MPQQACLAERAPLFTVVIDWQVRSDDIKSVLAKRMQGSKANKVMASIMPEFANFQVEAPPSHIHVAFRGGAHARFSCDQAPSSWVFKGE